MTNVAVLVPPSNGRARLSTYRAVFGGPVFDLSFAAGGLPFAGQDLLARADILAVAPLARGARDNGAEVAEALRDAARRNCRILAVGEAVLTLAAAGLLDGRAASTCPAHADELRRRFPRVRIAPGVRYVDDDPIFTAADGPAGLDLCLHLVRKYHGAAAAAAIARTL
ncbi:DJ-1/PfpI family protein [Actinoplanes friuliensis]|nr:DJ-1/PfpI family protein [Actinoplanes friuliensis]